MIPVSHFLVLLYYRYMCAIYKFWVYLSTHFISMTYSYITSHTHDMSIECVLHTKALPSMLVYRNLHSLKPTSPLKIGLPKRKVVFQPSIFQVLYNMLVSGRVICMFIALLMEEILHQLLVDRLFIPSLTRFYTSHVVVWIFFPSTVSVL